MEKESKEKTEKMVLKDTQEQKAYAFAEYSCRDFVEVLAGKAPVPGGGGASALAGAVGMALGHMVGSLTVGKKKYAEVEEEIIQCMKEAKEISDELLFLVEEDARSFEPLSRAYSLPKSTKEEQEKREQVMAAALQEACVVPLKIMETCARAIDLIETFEKKGSVMALSDAGVGAVLLKSALQGASLNITINTKSMKDRKMAENLNRKADSLRETYEKKADDIFLKVRERLQ